MFWPIPGASAYPTVPYGYGGYPGQLVFGQNQPGEGAPMIDDPDVSVSDTVLARLLALVARARGVRSSTTVGCPPRIGVRTSGGVARPPAMLRMPAPRPVLDDSGRPYSTGPSAAPGFTSGWNSDPASAMPGRGGAVSPHRYIGPGHGPATAPGFTSGWNADPATTSVSQHRYIGPGGHGQPNALPSPAPPQQHQQQGFVLDHGGAYVNGGPPPGYPHAVPGPTPPHPHPAPVHPHHAPRVHPQMLRQWSYTWNGNPFFAFGCWWVLTPAGWVCYLEYPYFFIT